MARCIFCKTTVGPFGTREHILPESLGGGDWAILPPELYCDGCQNRFGSAIEQQALADYPFSLLRVLMGIPTKKDKAPWMPSWEGKLTGSLTPGTFGYDPAPQFEDAILAGTKTQMRIVAHPSKPGMICRTLLKMGLETLAADDPNEVFDERFDAARQYALLGTKDRPWWYLQIEDIESVTECCHGGAGEVGLEIVEVEAQAEAFHLRLLYLDMVTPLIPAMSPPPLDGLPEPKFRLFVV
jgi:hypothetical protein